MSKITWPLTEAKKIIKRKKQCGGTTVFETGYGPSGLPHIGTFAEVARTTFIMEAYKQLAPEAKTRLIVFSDDMDGLRSLPENIPSHKMLIRHLGKPLSAIPDPFEKDESYAAHMNKLLNRFLSDYGFKYEFHSSTTAYKEGVFNKGLMKIMDNYEKIRDLFIKTISEEKRELWSPFFPVCEKCGKINTTRVTGISKENYRLSYVCDQDNNQYVSCGHSSETPIIDGHCKVGWKVDWALRWYSFKVDYEMYGKDLIDSAMLSSRICGVMGQTPPQTYKYELFLDETGAKISKKVGNGISMKQWREYAPLGALLHFLLANPNKARRMGLPVLPIAIDNYISELKTVDKEDSYSTIFYINSILQKNDTLKAVDADITCSLLVNLAESMGHDPKLLYKYALRYEPTIHKDKVFYQSLCTYVANYVQAYEDNFTVNESEIDWSLLRYLSVLKEGLNQLAKENTFKPEVIQSFLFDIAKKNAIEPKKWFNFLYNSLLNKYRGPRLGSFFALLGPEHTNLLIDNTISRRQQDV